MGVKREPAAGAIQSNGRLAYYFTMSVAKETKK
jgi:hypothetical protein